MPFRPNVNDTLLIDGTRYRIQEHPAISGTPYGQAGRRATVYQLADERGRLYALKVFYETFRAPHVAESADRLRPFAKLPGLQVCERIVLTSDRHGALIGQHDDLVYAALMPWIKGELWQEVLLSRRRLSPELSKEFAHTLVRILATMEQQEIAHCDLSGGNVMVVRTQGEVELIDVEDIYAAHLTRPTQLPGGSPGYAHREAPKGLWEPASDRFAGLVLLVEMLCWFDARVREAAGLESYFDSQYMQRDSKQLDVLRQVLRDRWGQAALETFERGWFSEKLNDCPSFQTWAAVLGVTVPRVPSIIVEPDGRQEAHALIREAHGLMELGQIDQAIAKFEAAQRITPELAARPYIGALRRRAAARRQQGDLRGALEDYRSAIALAPAGTDLHAELARELATVDQQLPPPAPASPDRDEARADEQRPKPAVDLGLPSERERDEARKQTLRSFVIVFGLVGVIVLTVALVFQRELSSLVYQVSYEDSSIIREVLAGGALATLIGALYGWAFRSTTRRGLFAQLILVTGACGAAGGLASGIIYALWGTTVGTTAIASAIGGAIAGGLAGWVQAAIRLRASPARRKRWVWLGAASWAITWCAGLTIGALISGFLGDAIGWSLVLVLSGAALALFGSAERTLEL